MRAVRLLHNHIFLLLLPLTGLPIAIYRRGIKEVLQDTPADLGRFIFFCTIIPAIQVITICFWLTRKLIGSEEPFRVIDRIIGGKEDIKRNKLLYIWINNTFFRGVHWVYFINGYEKKYIQTKYDMIELLNRCCRRY